MKKQGMSLFKIKAVQPHEVARRVEVCETLLIKIQVICTDEAKFSK